MTKVEQTFLYLAEKCKNKLVMIDGWILWYWSDQKWNK